MDFWHADYNEVGDDKIVDVMQATANISQQRPAYR